MSPDTVKHKTDPQTTKFAWRSSPNIGGWHAFRLVGNNGDGCIRESVIFMKIKRPQIGKKPWSKTKARQRGKTKVWSFGNSEIHKFEKFELTNNQLIDYWWFMVHGSRLVTQGSWPRKHMACIPDQFCTKPTPFYFTENVDIWRCMIFWNLRNRTPHCSPPRAFCLSRVSTEHLEFSTTFQI